VDANHRGGSAPRCQRKGGERLGEDEAGRLVAMLLDFHNQAVEKVPAPSRPPLKSAVQAKGR